MAEETRLIVNDGSTSRTVVIEATPFTMGRQEKCSLVVTDADVSRLHAEIVREGERYVLLDRSKFGTYVNGTRIEAPHPLAHGDHIQLGSLNRPPIEFQRVTEEITRNLRSSAGGNPVPVRDATLDGRTVDSMRARSMDMMGQALRAMIEGRGLEEILGIVVDQTVRLASADRGFVMLANPEGKLEIRMARGRRGLTLEGSKFDHSAKIPDEAFTTNRLQYLDDMFMEDEKGKHIHTAQFGIRSVLCVPLPRVRALEPETGDRIRIAEYGRPLGVLYVDSKGKGRLASAELHTAFEQLAAEAALAIENARLYKESLEKATLDKELRVAAELQQALLPAPNFLTAHYELASRTIPCRAVGGDFYEHAEHSENRIGFALGDVSGKGPPAALLAAVIQGILSSQAAEERGPGETLARLNRTLVNRAVQSRFATMAFGIARADGTLSVSNAGHNPTYVMREDGSLVALDKGGLPLGIFPDATYEEETVRLETGDTVVLFSDGVTEALNAHGEQFEDERLRACLAGTWGLSSEVVLDRLVDSVHEFAGGEPQADDITVLVVRYLGPGDPSA